MLPLLHLQEWKDMSEVEFVSKFQDYDFYLLYDDKQLVSLLRVNNAFSFSVADALYKISELVGFVSLIQGKGYGKALITYLKSDLITKNRECIGFCFAYNRGFYEKCDIEVFADSAKFFLEENEKGKWEPSEDDDVLNVNLSVASRKLMASLSDKNPAKFIDNQKSQSVPIVCAVPN